MVPLTSEQQSKVQQSLGIAGKATKSYLASHAINFTYSEIFQIATLGLITAVQRFNPDMSSRCFYQFAYKHCRGSISHYLRDKTTLIRTPRGLTAYQTVGLDISTDDSKAFIDKLTAPMPDLDEDYTCLINAVNSLKQSHRDLINDYYWASMSVAEIALKYNRSTGRVHNKLSGIRKHLRQILTKEI